MWSSKCHPCTLKPLHWLVCNCLCKNHGMSPMQSWSFFAHQSQQMGLYSLLPYPCGYSLASPEKSFAECKRVNVMTRDLMDESNPTRWYEFALLMSSNKMNFMDGINVDWMWCHWSCGMEWHLKADGLMSWVQIKWLFMNEINPIEFIEFDGWMWSYELEMSWNNHTGATGGN